MKTVFLFVIQLLAVGSFAHSPVETNALIRVILERASHIGSDTPEDNYGSSLVEAPVTWPAFLGHEETNGWTLVEKKNVFDWYLATLGTKNGIALPYEEQEWIRIAVSQCEMLNYRESYIPLKALASNPKGVYRDEAIEVSLTFAPVDDATTSFVETIMTNLVGYSMMERGTACGIYADNLVNRCFTNEFLRSARTRAAGMFYKNRLVDVASAQILDDFFCRFYQGYSHSSNRLDTLCHVLDSANCPADVRRPFVIITNRMLSSRQPLRQLRIGERGGE